MIDIDDLEKFIKENKVLVLPLQKRPFDLMVTGEKDKEFRKPTKFITDRLIDKKTGNQKEYDYVCFTNGYGYHLPLFIWKYEGYGTGYNNVYTYSDGFTITPAKEDYVLFLGEIIYKKNIKP